MFRRVPQALRTKADLTNLLAPFYHLTATSEMGKTPHGARKRFLPMLWVKAVCRRAFLPVLLAVEHEADTDEIGPALFMLPSVVMRERLFNCEVMALIIASYLISVGVLIFVEVFASPPEDKVPIAWEYCGFISLAMGLISGSVFWMIRRFLNKK